MKVTILGSASGISMPGRGHASVALESGSGLYIFDLGEPAGRTMLEMGLPLEKMRAAFVSHMHSDHSGGLVQFVKNLHLYHNHSDYLPQVDRITLAVPEEAVEVVKAWMAACYMFPERLNIRVDYLPVTTGRVYEDENVTVDASPTGHLASNYKDFIGSHPQYQAAKCQAFSFTVAAEGKRVVYSGDLGVIEDILPVARGADLVILEFGHMLPLGENLRKLAGLGIEKVIVTHIFPDYNDRAAELQEIADETLPGLVTVAVDGLVATL